MVVKAVTVTRLVSVAQLSSSDGVGWIGWVVESGGGAVTVTSLVSVTHLYSSDGV